MNQKYLKRIFFLFIFGFLGLILYLTLNLRESSQSYQNFVTLAQEVRKKSEPQSISQELENLHKIAIKVSNLYEKSGKGIPTKEGIDAVLQAKESHCGHLVYIFARNLQELDYEFRILGVSTKIKWNHAIIEVKSKINGRWYLFDPSNGIYYKNSFYDVWNNPNLAKEKVGKLSKNYDIYNRPRFFKHIKNVHVYSSLDDYEKDYAIKSRVISQSKFNNSFPPEASIDGNAFDDYTAAQENSYPNYFELDLGEKRKIYRFSIQWYDEENYASQFEILAKTDSDYVSIFSTNNHQENDSFHEIILKEPIDTDRIKFVVNKAEGQDRLLLRKFSVYRY